MDEKTLKNRIIRKMDMLLEREEKPLLLYLNSLHEETSVAIFILINGYYRLITVNKSKDLLWCLSQGLLATRHYLHVSMTCGDLEFTEIYIRELA